MSLKLITCFNQQDKVIENERTVFEGFFTLKSYQLKFRLFQGGWSSSVQREVLQHPGAVGILLYDALQQKCVFVEQFRSGVMNTDRSPWLVELVAGLIEPNETQQNVALREAEEEAGLVVSDILPICHYWTTPGISNEQMWLFCGKVDASCAPQYAGNEHEAEDIKIHVLDVANAQQALAKNEFCNAPTIIALQWLFANKAQVDQRFL